MSGERNSNIRPNGFQKHYTNRAPQGTGQLSTRTGDTYRGGRESHYAVEFGGNVQMARYEYQLLLTLTRIRPGTRDRLLPRQGKTIRHRNVDFETANRSFG